MSSTSAQPAPAEGAYSTQFLLLDAALTCEAALHELSVGHLDSSNDPPRSFVEALSAPFERSPTLGLASAVVAVACALAGCAVPHELPARQASTPTVPVPIDPPGPIVGVAFSGGGSRAAMFSAAVLKEIAAIDVRPAGEPPRSVLESVRYMSSVSGGSLAAATYVMRKPLATVPMMDGSGLSPDYQDFFDHQFFPLMMSNWEGPLIAGALGQVIPRADAVAGRWDDSIFGNATFTDLIARESAGDAPWLVMNGTSWDTGRRFAFTGLPSAAFEYDFLKTVRDYIGTVAPAQELATLDQRFAPETQRFVPMTFEEMNADPADLHVSLAVASSSSVPLLLGPVTFLVPGADGSGQVLHVGDGGMFDNQGIESLAQMIFPRLLRAKGQPASGRKALFLVIDASYPFDGRTDFYGRSDTLGAMMERSPARISDIMEQRATAYQLMLWASIRATQGAAPVVPDFDHLTFVYLRHTDAAQAIALDPPPECSQWGPKSRPSRDEMLTYLSRIPTRFRLVSDCDAALLRASAHQAVSMNRDRILRTFQ